MSLADVNRDGHTDIVFSEQEQSAQDRIGVYYNVDGSGSNWQLQILATTSGQNQDVGDVNGDGSIDILNSPHGEYTGHNPIELFLSQLVTGAPPAGEAGGPSARYEFEQTSGKTSEDISGNGHTATLIKSPVFVPGRSGQALKLNGKNQYARVNNSDALDPTTALTLSAWVEADDWKGSRHVLQKGPKKSQYSLAVEKGMLKFDLPGIGAITAPLPTTGEWHLLTATYDEATMTLYVDGVAAASAAGTGRLKVTKSPLTIGTKAPGSGAANFFHGLLDDVRVYARALSPDQVRAIFAGTG